jgi:hypothetical protein
MAAMFAAVAASWYPKPLRYSYMEKLRFYKTHFYRPFMIFEDAHP